MANSTKNTYKPLKKGSYKTALKMEDGGNVSELNYSERKDYIEQNYAPFIQDAQMIFTIFDNSFEYDYKKDRKEVVKEIIEYYESLGDYTEETLLKETVYEIKDFEIVRRELDLDTDEYYDETELEEITSDNTYNFSYLGLVDLNWRLYYDAENEKYFYVIMPHLGGDIRGNYGNAIILQGSDKDDLFYRFYEGFISGGASIYLKFLDGSEIGFDSEQDSDVFNFRLNEVFEPTGMAQKYLNDFEKFDSYKGDEFLEETIDLFLMRNGNAPKMMAGGSLDDETPKAYIEILGNNNEGKWIDLTDYSDGNDVIDGISEWMNELNEIDGGNREEYRVADFEGFGNDMFDEYMGMNDFDEIIEAYQKYTENEFPTDVIFEYKDNIGNSTKTISDIIDDMENNYFGRYDDYESFGLQMVDEGIYSPSVDDVYITDTDKRILAGEEADAYVDGLSFEDALEIATDVKEKYDIEKTELEEKIMYLDSEIGDLELIREDTEDEEYEIISEQIEEKEIAKDEVQNELDDIDSRFEDEAFEEVRDIHYELIYDKLENDLEDWLNEYGYNDEDLSKINFLSVDYDRIGEELSANYLVIEYNNELYFFSNYEKGGRLKASKRKSQFNYYVVENSTKKLVSGYKTREEAVEQRALLVKEYPTMRFEIFTLGNLEAKTNLDVNSKKDYVELTALDKIKQVSVDAYRYGQEKVGQANSFLQKHDVKGKIKRGARNVADKTKQGANWLKRQWQEADFGDGKGKAKFFDDGGIAKLDDFIKREDIIREHLFFIVDKNGKRLEEWATSGDDILRHQVDWDGEDNLDETDVVTESILKANGVNPNSVVSIVVYDLTKGEQIFNGSQLSDKEWYDYIKFLKEDTYEEFDDEVGVDEFDYDMAYEDIGKFSMPSSEWKNYQDEEYNKIGRKIVIEQFNGDISRAMDEIIRVSHSSEIPQGVVKGSKLIFSGGSSQGYKDVFYILDDKWLKLKNKGFTETEETKNAKDWAVAYQSNDGTHWGVNRSPYDTRYLYSPSLDLLREQTEGEWYQNSSNSDMFADGGESDDLDYIYINGRNEDAPEPLKYFGFSFIGEDSREQLHNWLNKFINEPAISVEKIIEVYRSGNINTTKDVTSKYLSKFDDIDNNRIKDSEIRIFAERVNKDGVVIEGIQEYFYVSAKNIDEAKEIATNLFNQDAYLRKYFQIIEVLSREELRLKYPKGKFADGGMAGLGEVSGMLPSALPMSTIVPMAKGGRVDNYKNVFNHLKKIKVYGKQGNSKSISDYLSVYNSPKNIVFFGSDNGFYSCEVDTLLKSNSKKELIQNSVFQGLLDDEFYTDDNDEFSNGGEVVRFYTKENERLGRPSGSIEKEILDKVIDRFEPNQFVGGIGWKTPQGKLADGYLYKLDDFDRKLVSNIRLKETEKIFRYFNRTTAIGGMTPLIKINLQNGMLYFAIYSENDDVQFETKGVKALWVSIIEDNIEYAKGGLTKNKKGSASNRSKSVIHTINGKDRRFPIKDAWRKEHNIENKSEDYEVPQEDRFAMGGDASEHYHEVEYGQGGVAKAKDVIINKIGWNEEVADYLVSRSEKFAIWLADSILKKEISNRAGMDKKSFLGMYNSARYINGSYNSEIRQILDWLQHPVTPKQELKQLSFEQALEKAREWHNELQVLGGDIDFTEPETNQMLKKYPVNSDGIEYYWVFIPSNYCDLESSRMGHCGRTGYGNNLISLRSVKPYGKGHTISDSHVTIAYGVTDGIFYQVKGKKNNKPAEKYFPYVFDLIKTFIIDNNVFIPSKGDIVFAFKGFGSEYGAEEDYGFEDMTNQEIREMYDLKPTLFESAEDNYMLLDAGVITLDEFKEIVEREPDTFSSFGNQMKLYERGIITEKPSTIFELNYDCDEVYRLLDLNKFSDDIVEKILCGDFTELTDSWDYYYENPSDLVDNLNKENTDRVIDEIVRITGYEKSDVEENGIGYYLNGEDENFPTDDFDNIIRVLASAQNNADQSDYYDYLYKQLESSLEELGEVHSLNDEGVKMTIDLSNSMSDEYISEKMDWYEFEDISELFREKILDYDDSPIERPRLRIDDRYSPYGSSEDFNEYVSHTDLEQGYAKGGVIEVVGKDDKGAFRIKDYEWMSENEVIQWWEERGYKLSKTKSESSLKPYTFYINNKFAVGGSVDEEVSYINRRISNLEGMLPTLNANERQGMISSIDNLKTEREGLLNRKSGISQKKSFWSFGKGGSTKLPKDNSRVHFTDDEGEEFDGIFIAEGNGNPSMFLVGFNEDSSDFRFVMNVTDWHYLDGTDDDDAHAKHEASETAKEEREEHQYDVYDNKRMLKNQAREVEHHSEELNNQIPLTEKVPAWLIAKMERATTDLSDVTHYLDGENNYADGGELGDVNYDVEPYKDKFIVVQTQQNEDSTYPSKEIRGFKGEFLEFDDIKSAENFISKIETKYPYGIQKANFGAILMASELLQKKQPQQPQVVYYVPQQQEQQYSDRNSIIQNIPKAESGGEMDMSQVNDFCMTQLIELANELQPLKYFVTQRFSSKEDKKEYVGKLILLFKEPVDKSVVNTISNFIEKAEDCHTLFEQSINFSDSEPKAITINILDENFADREFGRGGKVYDNSPKKINLDKTKKITTVLGDYNLGLITDDFVYYFNSSESDENAQTIMYNKKGELISDNYFATQDLLEILENNQDFEYIHPDLENYKKEIN